MGLLLTTIAAAVVWVVLVSLGTKSFDALLVSIAMIVIAGSGRVLSKFLPGNRAEEPPGDRYTPR